MTAHNSKEQTRSGTPAPLQTGQVINGRVRSLRASINLSDTTVVVDDTINLGKRPRRSRYLGHRITCGVSLGSAQLAIGVEGTVGKYRDAGTFTAVDTPTDVAKAAELAADPLEADEDMIATITAAALPTSDHELVIETLYTYD